MGRLKEREAGSGSLDSRLPLHLYSTLFEDLLKKPAEYFS